MMQGESYCWLGHAYSHGEHVETCMSTKRPTPPFSWSSHHRPCVAMANSYARSLEMPLTIATRTGKEKSLGAALCMLQSIR